MPRKKRRKPSAPSGKMETFAIKLPPETAAYIKANKLQDETRNILVRLIDRAKERAPFKETDEDSIMTVENVERKTDVEHNESAPPELWEIFVQEVRDFIGEDDFVQINTEFLADNTNREGWEERKITYDLNDLTVYFLSPPEKWCRWRGYSTDTAFLVLGDTYGNFGGSETLVTLVFKSSATAKAVFESECWTR